MSSLSLSQMGRCRDKLYYPLAESPQWQREPQCQKLQKQVWGENTGRFQPGADIKPFITRQARPSRTREHTPRAASPGRRGRRRAQPAAVGVVEGV